MSFYGENGKIWFNGEIMDWKDAKIDVLSHVVHYGSSVFEGIRCYDTKKGPAIFRLEDHVKRLYDSAKIYSMEMKFTEKEMCEAIKETIHINNAKSCYIRPIVFFGFEELGVFPLNCPVETAVATWAWGKYLGEEALDEGIDCCVSSWRKIAPDTMPALAKAGSNYMNSQLAKIEAVKNGYKESILLNYEGNIAEGTGENIFLVKDNELYTPSKDCSILDGITRNSVIKLAKDEGITVKEERLPREFLYTCDEVFFTGTAAEITPIRTVDKIKVGKGKKGPITDKLQEKLFEIFNAEVEDKFNWLTFI
ncbi:MAG: branched-chain amino acid transaminase [Methanobacteriaceae archaeon]|nr:branched-chain amino acid transaminase [Methanobacteriaceae archaeon]